MKHTSKILALVLIVMTIIMSLSAFTVSAETQTVTKVFNPEELGVVSDLAGTQQVGTDDFFTLNLSKSKNEAKSKTFDDGFASTHRFSLNGTSKVENESITRSISFTTPAPATIKVWWELGNAGRTLDLYGADLNLVENIAPEATGLYVSTFNVDAAGTYYLANMAGTVYFFKVEVSWTVELCDHEGGEATCAQQAICSKCNQPYGDLATNHNFVDGKCTICELPDPNICQHTNMAPATCLLPATCECGYTEGDPLGHDIIVDEAKAPTCTEKGLEAGEHCSRCDHKVEQKEVAALGHTLTFVNTLPTLGESGKTIADCSVCQEHFDYGEVNVMTPGTYVLEADSFAGIAQYSLYDGYVMVVNDVFTCHLSYKYRTDFYEAGKEKIFAEDDYVSAYRMNFGGASAFCNNGAGEEAVRNGGLKNYIQIVTTSTTYITVHWGVGGDNREVGIYDMEGNLLRTTEEKATKNDLVVSENIELPAGAYLIGSAASDGGNWIHKITVEVEAPHECSFSEPTCTEPGKCECGATQGEALGHDMVIDAAKAPTCTEAGLTSGEHCSRCDHAVAQEEIPALGHNFAEGKCDCGAEDPNYVAPQPEAEEEVELNFFQKIIAWFTNLINKIIAIFKK